MMLQQSAFLPALQECAILPVRFFPGKEELEFSIPIHTHKYRKEKVVCIAIRYFQVCQYINKWLRKNMSQPTPPAGYYGKILTDSYSFNLRNKVSEQISVCSSFDQIGLSVMPYIAAWRTHESSIWYEFVSDRLLDLFNCEPEKMARAFHNSIIDHRQYQHTDIYPDIKESILDKNDLENERKRLRNETVKKGVMEAIYKLALPNNQNVWLKDQASVTLFEKDRICLSPGYLCNVSLEMSRKDHLDEINVTVNRDKYLLVEAERSAALGQISAKILHEIRNPILSIGGLAKRLLKKQEAVNSRRYLDVIAKEADRLENVLNNLFDYTKRIQIAPKPTDMEVLTKDVIDLLQSDFDRQNIKVNLAIEEQIPEVMIDREQMHFALVHILKNSIEAMLSGGSLSITIRQQKGSVAVSICDSGDGILAGHTRKVTEPFFTTKIYGTGLGLSLAKKAIDLHEGSLTFKQPDTNGTEVIVQLPLRIFS